MRILIFLLFIVTPLYADLPTRTLVDNCDRRPVGLLFQLNRWNSDAQRGDVEEVVSKDKAKERAKSEFGCNDKALEVVDNYCQELLNIGWQKEIDHRQFIIETKLERAPAIDFYEEVRNAKSEINRFAGKLGKNLSEYISIADVDLYIEEGIDQHIESLKKLIDEQAKYRDPTELIKRLELLAQAEGRENVLYSSRKRANLIKKGLAAQKERQASCTDVNNLKEPLNYNNVRSQDDVGWCFAFVGADLVAHKLGEMVSPVDMALKHNDFWLPWRLSMKHDRGGFNRETDLEGGFAGLAIRESMDEGFCPERLIPENAAFVKSHHDYIGVLRSLEDFYHEYHSNENTGVCMEEELKKNSQELLPNLEFADLLKIVATSTRNEFLDKVIDANCEGHRVKLPEGTKVKSYTHLLPYTKNFLWNKVDQQLNEGNILGMVYYEGVLHDHRDFTDPLIDGHHVSIVVGRRFNEESGSCEYLIRNSHGDWCQGYDLEKYECTSGHIWIGEQYLNRSLANVSYL